MMTSCYKLLATDFDKQQKDDQLFPGRASDKIMSHYPPTVIWTSEFDFLRRDNEKLAERLKGLGRLAAFSQCPGTIHDYHQLGNPEEVPEIKRFYAEEIEAFRCLVTEPGAMGRVEYPEDEEGEEEGME